MHDVWFWTLGLVPGGEGGELVHSPGQGPSVSCGKPSLLSRDGVITHYNSLSTDLRLCYDTTK